MPGSSLTMSEDPGIVISALYLLLPATYRGEAHERFMRGS